MKERPILSSGPMIRAIQEGRKTQTRRVIRGYGNTPHYGKLLGDWALSEEPRQWDGKEYPWKYQGKRNPKEGDWIWVLQCDVDDTFAHLLTCPYGQPGDLLWIRETWMPGAIATPDKPYYRASVSDVEEWDKTWKWHPSIYMPKKYARLWLRITNVRAERLQEIPLEDLIAEGTVGGNGTIPGAEYCPTARQHFRYVWDSLNAKRGYSWESNPWVWVVEFERIER